jgi:hypothetical protein
VGEVDLVAVGLAALAVLVDRAGKGRMEVGRAEKDRMAPLGKALHRKSDPSRKLTPQPPSLKRKGEKRPLGLCTWLLGSGFLIAVEGILGRSL